MAASKGVTRGTGPQAAKGVAGGPGSGVSSTIAPWAANSTRPVCAPVSPSRRVSRASCTAPQVASSAPSANNCAVVALAVNSCCFAASSLLCGTEA